MSHTLEYMMRQTNERLLEIIRTTSYSNDRNLALQVLERRGYFAFGNEYADRMQNMVTSLEGQVSSLRDTNRQLYNRLNTAVNQIQSMQRNHTQEIANVQNRVSQQIAESDRAHRQELDRVARDAKRRTEQSERELRRFFEHELEQSMEQTARQIEATRVSLQQELTATARELQGEIDGIRADVSVIGDAVRRSISDREELRRQAQEYQQAAQAVIAAVDAFNTRGWRAARRDELRNTDDRVTAYIGGVLDLAPSAFDHSLTLMENALIYQQEVLADERRWQMLLAAADEAVANTEALLESSRELRVRLPAGEQTLDVDYWTCGDLRTIREGLAAIRARMQDPSLTETELQALQELALTYRGQIPQAVSYAAQAFQLSRGRRQLMDSAIRRLIDPSRGNFFTHEWSQFFNGDERLGYRALLTDDNGTQVVITAELTDRGDNTPANVFRSEILRYGSQIRSAEQADAFNRNLLSELNKTPNAVFGNTQCTNVQAPPPDRGQTSQTDWRQPGEAACEEALEQVAHHTPQPVLQQIDAQRAAAGIPAR